MKTEAILSLNPKINDLQYELLAPAGSFGCAEAAFEYGADAVYAGVGKFNLRAHAPNFTVGEFAELVDFAEGRGKKVYGVLNIIPNDEMLDSIEDTLKEVRGGGAAPHAFIVSDPGVLSIVKSIFGNDIPIHLSTQSGCFNSKSMQFWKNQGVTRVILPRELNLGQIRRLSSLNILETEIFIHGAMCVSVSGRCLMGAYYNRRHPNLGDCPQPCRFKYRITSCEYDDHPQPIDIKQNTHISDGFDAEESKNGVYLLNSKDLCVLDILPDVMKSGAVSFKIEGRNKTAHYVASVVKVYRDAIDTYLADPQNYHPKNWWTSELEGIDHRPYTTGFYADDPIKQEHFSSKAQAGYRLAGIVKGIVGGNPIIDVKNSFGVASGLVNVLPVKRGQVPFELRFSAIREFDGGDNGIGTVTEKARPNRLVLLENCGASLRVGDMLRVKDV